MSLATTSALAGLAATIIPILACLRAVRTGKSRVYILLMTGAVATVSALCYSIPMMQAATQTGGGMDNIPYVLANVMLSGAITGVIIGAAGVLLQMLDRKRRQRA